MKYKLMISDYDSTLGNDGFISEENIRAIKEYQKKGGIFCVCTGRLHNSIIGILNKYGIKCAVASYQGAKIVNEEGELIFNGGIEKNLLLEVIKDFNSEGLYNAVFCNDKLNYDTESPYIDFYRKDSKECLNKTDNVYDFVKNSDAVFNKLTGVAKEIPKDLEEKYNNKYKGKLIFNSGSHNLLEVVNPACCKGEAVKRIAKYYGVDLSEVIAVGDSTNDIELIKGKWHGVAVGNSKESLKKVAKEITVSCNDNAISVLLKKYSK